MATDGRDWLVVEDLAVRYGEIAAVKGISFTVRERIEQASGTLSGGEQQMLAVGRAMMSGAKTLLLDEPSMGLAPLLVQEIYRVLGELNAAGATILLVEQNANMALALAHRAAVLETGAITLAGDAAALREDARVKAAYLGA